MFTVGGLLLGAVLSAPGAASSAAPVGPLAEPFDPAIPRVAIARADTALGLRDPFGPDPVPQAAVPLAAAQRRALTQRADLRDPFESVARRGAVAPHPAATDAGLRSPFAGRRPSVARPANAATADLRDPFGR
ncbi:MAG: hypothetical protein K0V04_43010 [Deltaproteobacteria bacterium]|nr:hypothetical protein [Deltaproteobacteria bacterium]